MFKTNFMLIISVNQFKTSNFWICNLLANNGCINVLTNVQII
jgi:hypothetical protein